MLKPEQVPDEAMVAFQKAWADPSTLSTKECLAAAINAWPGIRMMVDIDTGDDSALKLPLPKEAGDE